MVHHVITEDQKIEAPYLKVYATNTGNGMKVTTLLELLGVEYYLKKMDLLAKEQKEPWFIKLNEAGKIPHIVDVDKDGNEIHLNESCAIMMYLSDKYDTDNKYTFEKGSKLYYEQLEWLLFQATNLTPVRSNLTIWSIFRADEHNEGAINFYDDYVKFDHGVLEKRLKKNGTGYLVGDHLSLADISTYLQVDFGLPPKYEKEMEEDWPLLNAWVKRVGSVPEIVKGKML